MLFRSNPQSMDNIHHFSHEHPLTLADKVAIFAQCSCCGDLASRPNTPPPPPPIYECSLIPNCWFHLHKSCLDLPQELMQHPFHPNHPLSLIPQPLHGGSGEFLCCACGKNRRGFAFHCDKCDFYLDVRCASLMPTSKKFDPIVQHLGHSHPLIVCDMDKNFQVSCSACELPFDQEDSIYVCLECKLLLHKHCAQLPPRIQHPFHPHHPLLLFEQIPAGELFTRCKGCWKDFKSGFTYRCIDCDFLIGTGCAFLVSRIFHFHEHPLALFEKTKFSCSKCKCRKCSGVLRCVLCGFSLHLHCFPGLPEMVEKRRCHRHPLRLTKIPIQDYEDEEEDAEFYCDACEELRYLPDPTYYCEEDHYVAHVLCMVSKEEILSQGEESHVVSEIGEMAFESSGKAVREVMNNMKEKQAIQDNDSKAFSSLAELDAEIQSLSAERVTLTAKIEGLRQKRARFIFR